MAARSRKASVVEVVSETEFGTPSESPELLHRALRLQAQARRQGTQSTKSRGDVVGSTAKLYRQKGTGRARAGDARASQRRGGGIAFGPRSRDVHRRINRRERRHALATVLAAKARDQRVHLAKTWGEAARTKDRAAWLAASGLVGRVLLVDVEPPEDLRRSSANLADVKVAPAGAIGFYDIASSDHVVLSEAALTALKGAKRGR